MESNAVMIKAEVLLRFMLYTTPKRTQAIPISGDIWVSREMALGEEYALGTEHQFTSLRGQRETHHYVVAMLPLIRRIPQSGRSTKEIVHVTVYFAEAEKWSDFIPVDQLTPDEIRQSMLSLEEN